MSMLHPGATAPFPPFALPGVDCSACHPEAHTLCSCGALCDAHRKAPTMPTTPDGLTTEQHDERDDAQELAAERGADYDDDGRLS